MGPSPRMIEERRKVPVRDRWRSWIDDKRGVAGRQARRYPTLEDALGRMKAENGYLTDAQARHLTEHGVSQNEDGTYSWKFDNYLHVWNSPQDIDQEAVNSLWAGITCPTLLLYGKESRSGDPAADGRARHFPHARVVGIDGAGHWLHHDRLDVFLQTARDFLSER